MSQLNNPNFSVIIPNYNGSKFIPDCLNSLVKSINLCPKNQFELIFVDNGSTDNSIELVKKSLSKKPKNLRSTIHKLHSNLGFASAVNQGINQAKYNWVVILNNDLIMDTNWFKIISQEIKNNKNPKISTFFGTVLNKNGTKIESQGFEYNYSGKCTNISNGKIFNKQDFIPNTKYQIPNTIIWGAPAALIVYNKNILKKIGLFDNDFFAYQEDVDLAFRLNKLGYLTQYIPSAISYHFGGGTSNRMGILRYRMNVRNWIYLIIKNYSFQEFWTNFLSIIAERLKLLFELITKTIDIYKIKSIFILPFDLIKTFFEIIFNFPKMIHKRHQTQKMLKSINY